MSPSPDANASLPPRMIDAHMHVWDLALGKHPWLCGAPIPFRYGDYSKIRRTYLVDDYLADTGHLNVVASVYIEAEWDPADPLGEMRWVHEVAEQSGYPNAVAAQAWLDREDAAEVLAGVAAFPLVRGVRHKPASAGAPADAVRGARGSMDDPKWREGYARLAGHGLHFELQTPWWHFDAASELARDFPETTIVLNHTGLPADRSEEGLAGWRAAMAHLAERPNVTLKISGIGVKGETWSREANAGIVRDALTIFGAERTMFASNFPVDSVVGAYTDIFEGFSAITADLTESARQALFHDNAARLYRITTGAAETQPDNTGG